MKDIPTQGVAIATVVVLVFIMLFSTAIFKQDVDSSKLVYLEEPLVKNSGFQLSPGEVYVYGYSFNNTQVNMSYEIFRGKNCTRIRLMEMINDTESCVDSEGMDSSGMNTTLENPSMLLFKPWMLALQDGWHWNNSLYLSFGDNTEQIATTEYRVLRRENYNGRMAFVVMENTSNGGPQYSWVDEEKRVLVKTMGDGYEVFLVGAPWLD